MPTLYIDWEVPKREVHMKKILVITGIVAAAVFGAKKLFGRKQDVVIDNDAPVSGNGYVQQAQA
jgi:hypothetical protein